MNRRSLPTYPLSMLFTAPLPVAHVASHVLDAPVEGHRHEFFEVAVVLAGYGDHVTEHDRVGLHRGDVVVLTPGTWHGYDTCRDLEVVNCCIPPSVARHELGWARVDPLLSGLLWPVESNSQQHITLNEEELGQALTLLGELTDTAAKGNVWGRAEMVGLVTVLLARLGQRSEVADVTPRAMPEPVLTGISMLECAPTYRWHLTELAAALHVTPSHLTRLFTQHTGTPPMVYLNRYRAELAAMLLRRTDEQVSAVGARVGWPDPNYFARRFRQHFGVSPTNYRARVTQWHEETTDLAQSGS